MSFQPSGHQATVVVVQYESDGSMRAEGRAPATGAVRERHAMTLVDGVAAINVRPGGTGSGASASTAELAAFLIRDGNALLGHPSILPAVTESAAAIDSELALPLLAAIRKADRLVEQHPAILSDWMVRRGRKMLDLDACLGFLRERHDADLTVSGLTSLVKRLTTGADSYPASFVESIHAITSVVLQPVQDQDPRDPLDVSPAFVQPGFFGTLRRLAMPWRIGRRKGASATGSLVIVQMPPGSGGIQTMTVINPGSEVVTIDYPRAEGTDGTPTAWTTLELEADMQVGIPMKWYGDLDRWQVEYGAIVTPSES